MTGRALLTVATVGAVIAVIVLVTAVSSGGDANDPLPPVDLPAAAVRDGIVDAYADALAPVFWYLVPFIAIAFVLSLVLKQIPLSDVAGLVARGEAVGGEEAERLEAEQRAGIRAGARPAEATGPDAADDASRIAVPSSDARDGSGS